MLTGKPDAGNPHVRFGGRGGELYPRSYPNLVLVPGKPQGHGFLLSPIGTLIGKSGSFRYVEA